MKADGLAINSQCTFQHNLEEALDAYAAAGFKNVEPHLNLVKDWLGVGLAGFVSVFNPEVVVVGGEAMGAENLC